MTQTQTQLSVGPKLNAGFGDFYPVTTTVDGEGYGVDAYVGTGSARERGANPTKRELTDWQDGNGLLANMVATEAEVWAAVQAAE